MLTEKLSDSRVGGALVAVSPLLLLLLLLLGGAAQQLHEQQLFLFGLRRCAAAVLAVEPWWAVLVVGMQRPEVRSTADRRGVSQ